MQSHIIFNQSDYRWDIDAITKEEEEHGSSHDVHIIFLALKSTICETIDKGSKLQGRNIASHIIAIVRILLNYHNYIVRIN